MNKWSQQKRRIEILTKQGINCWLAYMLSQPVDIDLNVVAFLIKDYLGVYALRPETNNAYIFSVTVTGHEKEKSFEKAIA